MVTHSVVIFKLAMIQSFSNNAIENFFFDDKVPRLAGWVTVRKIVRRKLSAVDAAKKIIDLKVPPGNHLESLTGDLRGFYSIRVNDQWCVIFEWPPESEGPTDVDVVDYH